MKGEYAVIQIIKLKGGRSIITNHSQRGIFSFGERYFNHRLKGYPERSGLNVTIRLSATGRRMVQLIESTRPKVQLIESTRPKVQLIESTRPKVQQIKESK